ncbi:MAG: SPFH domain-containing protein [Candidatus Bathyarchaeota archaeon]|nr:SPFH domain-containing protein [Candidatus Bathyarchaeota archaeon]
MALFDLSSGSAIFTLMIAIVLLVLLLIFVLPGFALVRDNEVGILTKKMSGKKLPQGKIIASDGEIGVQADTLMPGLYWRFPIIWKINKGRVTQIPQGSIGIIESIDGHSLQKGRLLADDVECNSFQDAKAFLNNGGRKGPQIDILLPGTYRINTAVFRIELTPALEVPKEMIGVVVAMDGTPLPSGYIVAPEPQGDHKHFQDGEAFITAGGYRGPQLETLQPGEYYINKRLFTVSLYSVAVVPPGYVAVVISSVGKELASSPMAPAISVTPDLNQPVHEAVESLLITDKSQRGIFRDPIAPGTYNLNLIAYKAELVPTSAITIDWASTSGPSETKIIGKERSEVGQSAKITEFFKFSQLRVTSKDGFQLDVDVRLIIRIQPPNAPFVIARFGTVSNLIEQVAHPLIDSSFRNEAGKKAAMEFVHSRTELQLQALEKAREEFSKYHVEVQGLLIAYINVDTQLLETQTKKEIAVQQQKQYEQEALAQEQRIAVAEKTARANQQENVISAKLSIEIAADRAEAARREAEGIRDATKTKADGTAYENEQVGEGIAAAYKAQTEVLGQQNVAALKLFEEIANGKIVITPEVQVTGGGDSGNLVNALLATMLKKSKTGTQ